MEEKRNFFGVSEESLAAIKAKEVKKQKILAKTTEEQTKDLERKTLLKEQGVDLDSYFKKRRKAMWSALWWIPVGFCTWFSLGVMVNGFVDAFQGKETYEKEWSKSVVNPFVDGKFKPTTTWYRQIAALIITIIVAMAEWQCSNERYRADKKTIQAVDMMAGLKALGDKYNLNRYQVKRLVRLVPDIINSMSAKDRTYFDMLMNDQINIKNNKTALAFAENVMMGHLLSHPEDAVKIWEKFEEKTIPYALAQRCKMYMEASK